MNVKSHGVDLVACSRLAESIERHGQRFLDRVFTRAEQAYCRGKKREIEHYAGRFAAKEAASKALGTGIGPISWREVETLHKWSGEPYLVLHGAAERIAKELGLAIWAVSLSHSRENGIAVVVATSD